jgi:hypothetical protein
LEREIKNRADCVKSNEEAVVVSKKKKKWQNTPRFMDWKSPYVCSKESAFEFYDKTTERIIT